jgi:hypothetical protein
LKRHILDCQLRSCMSIILLVTDPNKQTRQSVYLLNQAAAQFATACVQAGLLAGVKVLRSASPIEILRGFRQLSALLLHVTLYDARHSQRNS